MPKLAANNMASQRDLAYRSLRRLLVLQQIEPGQRLREPQWAQRLRVHRTALREAFARLEAEGMIERGERTGYFVPALTVEDFAEVAKLRLALECLAIEEVCAAAKPGLAAMEQASEEFARLMEGGYSLGAIEADRRFHEALIDAAQMRRLSNLYQLAPLPLIHGDTRRPGPLARGVRAHAGRAPDRSSLRWPPATWPRPSVFCGPISLICPFFPFATEEAGRTRPVRDAERNPVV